MPVAPRCRANPFAWIHKSTSKVAMLNAEIFNLQWIKIIIFIL
jgi:hypothetical protein